MRRGIVLAVMAFFLAFAVLAFADKGMPVYKAGDKVFVCGCGTGCDCLTVARKAGKCSCGKQLAESVVDKVADGKIYVKVKDKELTFPTKARYVCGCGEGCNCGTMGQKPGKCACGTEMMEVN